MTIHKRTVSRTVEIPEESLSYFMYSNNIVASEANRECVLDEIAQVILSKNRGVHNEVITPDNFSNLQLNRGFRATLPDPYTPEEILDDIADAGNPTHRLLQARTVLFSLQEGIKTEYAVTVFVEGYQDLLTSTCKGDGNVSTEGYTFYKPAMHDLAVKVLDAIKTEYVTVLSSERKKYGLPKLPKK